MCPSAEMQTTNIASDPFSIEVIEPTVFFLSKKILLNIILLRTMIKKKVSTQSCYIAIFPDLFLATLFEIT